MSTQLPDSIDQDTPAASIQAYEIAVTQRTGYLFVTVSGENTVGTIGRYSADIQAACLRLGQHRVLVVVNLRGPRLSMLDVYKTVTTDSDQAAGMGMHVAYVDLRPEPSIQNMQIAEDVAVTRGVRVRTFTDIGMAETWLLDATTP